MDIGTVIATIAGLEGVVTMEAAGDSYFIYDPHGDLPDNRKMPFATVMTGDRYDTASDLDRDEGSYRLNLGLTRATFTARFATDAPVDHAARDVVVPHPVYGDQHWVGVVNPSDATFDGLRPLIDEAHQLAVRKFTNHRARVERSDA